jgi:hypothetical protein
MQAIREHLGAEVTSEDTIFHYLDDYLGHFDDGEPLELPPQPNIGGEGQPDYAGPHYESVIGEEPRFVPYNMLHDPIPGTAVHKVGNVAVAGPLPAKGENE